MSNNPTASKVTDYPQATIVDREDVLYVVQDGRDKQVSFETLLLSMQTTTTTAAPTTTTAP